MGVLKFSPSNFSPKNFLPTRPKRATYLLVNLFTFLLSTINGVKKKIYLRPIETRLESVTVVIAMPRRFLIYYKCIFFGTRIKLRIFFGSREYSPRCPMYIYISILGLSAKRLPSIFDLIFFFLFKNYPVDNRAARDRKSSVYAYMNSQNTRPSQESSDNTYSEQNR